VRRFPCARMPMLLSFTAGAKQRSGETRLALAARNGALFRELLPGLVEVAPNAVILVVTNPVDVLTRLAIELTGRDDGSVFGSGTVLGFFPASASLGSSLRDRGEVRPCVCDR